MSSGCWVTGQLGALEWLKQRPGRKHLIAGNHDSVHPMHHDSHKWLPIYLDGVFETVQLAAKRRIPLREGHRTALLSHFPYQGDHAAQQRYTQWRLPDEGDYNIHGHVHSTERISYGPSRPVGLGEWARSVQIHVGVDAWGFRPVSLAEIRAEVWKAEGAE